MFELVWRSVQSVWRLGDLEIFLKAFLEVQSGAVGCWVQRVLCGSAVKGKKKDLTNLASSKYDRIKGNKGAFQFLCGRFTAASRGRIRLLSGEPERRSRCVRRSSGVGHASPQKHACPADM